MQKQMSESERQLFLLGGHDLEMLTIRQQLDRTGIAYVDHQLRWDNARLSSYRKELEEGFRERLDCLWSGIAGRYSKTARI